MRWRKKGDRGGQGEDSREACCGVVGKVRMLRRVTFCGARSAVSTCEYGVMSIECVHTTRDGSNDDGMMGLVPPAETTPRLRLSRFS